MMIEDLITSPSQLHGLPATAIGSFDCRARYLRAAKSPLSLLYGMGSRFFDIDVEYSRVFPDCNETHQIGGFVAAREQILLNQTIEALANGTVKNVVVLASGLSATGAYVRDVIARQFPDSGAHVICTDLPEPLCLQRSLCRHILAAHTPRGVSFQALDVLLKQDWDEIESQLVDGGVAIICEGLLGYFNLEKVSAVFARVAALLRRRSGFFLTDIATRKGLQSTIFDGDSDKLLRRFYEVADVRPEDLAFKNGQDCLDYLAQQGLRASRVKLQHPDQFYQPKLINDTERNKLRKILRSAVCIDVRVP